MARAQGLLGLLEEQALAKIGDYTSQGISLTLWAYATLGIQPGEEMVDGLERQAAGLMTGFNSQDIAMTLRAYAKLGIRPRAGIVAGLERRWQARRVMGEFQPREISHALWAYATLRLVPGAGLLDDVERRAASLMNSDRFNPQDLSMYLRACATLGIRPGRAISAAIEKRVTADIGCFNAQGLSNTLWAYAAFDQKPGGNTQNLLCEAANLFAAEGSLSHENIQQLHTFLLVSELQGWHAPEDAANPACILRSR